MKADFYEYSAMLQVDENVCDVFCQSYVLEDLSFPTFCIRFLIIDGCGEVFTNLKAIVKLILLVELNVQGHLFIPSSSTTISWRSTLMTTSSPMMLLIIISDHSSLNLKLHNHINDFIFKPVYLIFHSNIIIQKQ